MRVVSVPLLPTDKARPTDTPWLQTLTYVRMTVQSNY